MLSDLLGSSSSVQNKRKLAVECTIGVNDKLVIRNLISGKSVELCACCSKESLNALMATDYPLLLSGRTDDDFVAVSRKASSSSDCEHHKEAEDRAKSDEFLPLEEDVSNEDNELPHANDQQQPPSDSLPAHEKEDDSLVDIQGRLQNVESIVGETEVDQRGTEVDQSGMEVDQSGMKMDQRGTGTEVVTHEIGNGRSQPVENGLGDKQQKNECEVNGSGCRVVCDEEAMRQFGISSDFEIPISLQRFNKMLRKINSGRQTEKSLNSNNTISELERQSRLGERFLSQIHRKKMQKLTEGSNESSDEDDQRGEQQNSSEESDDEKESNNQPQTIVNNNVTKLRGHKRKGAAMLSEEMVEPNPTSNSCGKRPNLSKDSENCKTSTFENIEQMSKAMGDSSDVENEDESAKTDNDHSPTPPPKMTRAQHRKNLELKKLFRKANRAMIEDDQEEDVDANEDDLRINGLEDGTGEKGTNNNRPLKRCETLRSSSSEIVIDSEEESMKSHGTDSEDDHQAGQSGPKRRKTMSDGYEVLTLDDKPFAGKRNGKNKPSQKKTEKQRKKPLGKKVSASRKNKHLASDDEKDEYDEIGHNAGNNSDELDEVVPSTDEDVPKTSSSKKVISRKDLAIETKAAEKAEKERRKRLEERQMEFNGIELVTNKSSDNPTLVYKGEGSRPALKSIVLDPDKENDSPDPVRVHPSLVHVLKRHQAEGIRFLYNCTIESLFRLNEPGGGAILGHCMGLGKTLQIIAFLHTILSHPQICETIHKVLIFAPKNVLLNWVNEFDKWLFDNDPELDGVLTYSEIGSLTENADRLLAIKRWAKSKKPSVLIIGYDMFRRLTESAEDKPVPKRGGKVRPQKPKQKTKAGKELDRLKSQFREFLFQVPHLIICDEGHKLKNCDSAISKTINRIVARRRVCLTGTPLQNNLSEYYCMVNFVKPNLLGNIKEFKSRFEYIINRGRTVDASKQDVLHMKRRCHVLHDRLRGILDRRDYTVLKESLPPKQEYVLMVRLTQPQIELYRHFLEFAQLNGTLTGTSLLQNHIILYRIWTHPYLIIEHERDEERKQLMLDCDDFVVPDSEDTDEEDELDEKAEEVTDDLCDKPSSSSVKLTPTRRSRRQNGDDINDERTETPIELKAWAKNHVTEEDRNRFELSNKLILLAEIVKKCEAIGDKLLVFSQFLNSMALIRRMLAYYADNGKWFVDGHDALMRQGEKQWSWEMGLDYDVIDGAVSAKDRDRIQREFNDQLNLRKRLLLISTRAGSLGINLVGANRVVIFDCCWNPSHDTQSLFRVYRFGQEKPVYIYRFVAQGTMEERIYNRQVTKESTARRVTEAAQIQRHYKVEDLELMYRFEPEPVVNDSDSQGPHLDPPRDRLLGDIILSGTKAITAYHTHDLLLTSIEEEQLTPEEREEAWKEYEREREPRQLLPPPPMLLPPGVTVDGAVLPPGMSQQQQPFSSVADMAHFTNALQLRQKIQLLQAAQMHKQQALARQQQSAREGEIGYFTHVMGQLFGAYNSDPIYKLCFQVAGMQTKTAYRIFQIKQFLSYFVTLIPSEELGEMNNANAFANYFNGIIQNAIQEKQSQETVEEKALITLATTIEIARHHEKCQAGILFIKQMFPEVMQHLDHQSP